MKIFLLTNQELFVEELQRIISTIIFSSKGKIEDPVLLNNMQVEINEAIAKHVSENDCIGLFKFLSVSLKTFENEDCKLKSPFEHVPFVFILHPKI